MYEQCSCGAYIRTLSYKRVQEWRNEHKHPEPQQPEEPKPAGEYSNSQISTWAAAYRGGPANKDPEVQA